MRKPRTFPAAETNSVGHRVPTSFAGSTMFSPKAWEQIGRSLGLSGRELQIVQGTFDHKTEFAMAADLHISPNTVHSHVERLHRKLVITDRAQLLLRVIEEFFALTEMPGSNLPPICCNRATGRCPLRT